MSSFLTSTCGTGRGAFAATGGAMTGKLGGLGGSAAGVGGVTGAGDAASAGAAGSGAGTEGASGTGVSAMTAGGGDETGAFGFSLNFPGSATLGAAVCAGNGATGASSGGKNSGGGGVAAATGVAATGTAGATGSGFGPAGGSTMKSGGTAGCAAGVITGSGAVAGATLAVAGAGLGSPTSFGFSRIRAGCSVGATASGAGVEGLGTPGATGDSGAAPAASGCAARRRGFNRSEGVGAGSSLMNPDQTGFSNERETKKTLKDSLAVACVACTLTRVMTKRLLPIFLSVGVLLSSGCIFSKKPRKEQESATPASQTEKVFRERWIARRTAELSAQGVTTPQQQAEQEFQQKYSFANPRR